MTREELAQLICEVQARQSELDNIEAKAARHGTPGRLYEPISAFANRTGGGVILFGLDEESDFSIVGVGDAQRLQEGLTSVASEMEPAIRPEFTVDEVDGETIVAAEIEEVPASRKPCYFKPAGLPKGAYIRAGNTNRRMSDYEVFGYMSSQGQPTDDEDAIPDASTDDLNSGLLDQYIVNLRSSRPRAQYLDGPRDEVLTRLRILVREGDAQGASLAGLLMFGKYPQEFLPQLTITFVQYHGTSEDEPAPNGARFVDNRTFEGPIPEMLQEAETYILGAMRKSSLIEGMFRRELPEYPREVLREALANAVAHRDYSRYVRGGYVQVRMFADRLEVHSPGGLFGNVNEENIEEEHSTRNARLMRIMEDMHLVENRGSGIQGMLRAMREANLEPPQFRDRRSSFLITFRNHTLMNSEAISWLNQFADIPLEDRQRVALVYLRHRTRITNPDYRRLNRVDAMQAGRDLRGLVDAGLIEQHGTRRWTNYSLKTPAKPPAQVSRKTDEDQVVAYVREHGSITNPQCCELLRLESRRARYLLKKLSDDGGLRPEGQGRWRRYVLP